MTADATAQKRALRAEIRERRQNMPDHERQRASEGIAAELQALTAALGATRVACYLSNPVEPDTRRYLNWAEANGIQILFPISRDDGLLDWAVGDGHTEVEGLFGMPEPVGELLGPMAIDTVDLIIVPAAAIDLSGMRMGWGRGYFDKTLGSMQKVPPVYAVVFDTELLDSIPREVHDQPVHGVVTPRRTVRF